MNWLNLLYLLPLGFLYWLFLAPGRGYRLIHSEEQLLSGPELRFRYTEEELTAYFDTVRSQEELAKLWHWKYAATAIFLLVMAGIPFNFDLPQWLRISMLAAAALRAVLGFAETALLHSLLRKHQTGKALAGAKAASALTSLKWCATALWLLGLFGFLMVRAAKQSS